MLKFRDPGLYESSLTSYNNAVDGQMGQTYVDCANSGRSDQNPMWLSIDLGHLYSVSKIRMLSRLNFGAGSRIYVGQTAINSDESSDPTKGYQCGSTYPRTAPTTLTDFVCSTIQWVQYVTIWREATTSSHSYYLQLCEIEVYYNENKGTVQTALSEGTRAQEVFDLDDGVTITKGSFPLITVGEIALCGSSKGDIGPIWKFPNHSKVSTQSSAAIQQTESSPGFKQLRLNNYQESVGSNGNYKCVYTANGMVKTKTVNVVSKKVRAKKRTHQKMPCSWLSCNVVVSVFIIMRERKTDENHYFIPKQQLLLFQVIRSVLDYILWVFCSFVAFCCIMSDFQGGKIDMKNAVSIHGPLDTAPGLSASLAIDGSTSSCAATSLSTSPWLRVDLRTAYLITSVEILFWESPGDVVIVRVGSNLTKDGNANPTCGQPIRNSSQG